MARVDILIKTLHSFVDAQMHVIANAFSNESIHFNTKFEVMPRL